MSCQAKYTIHDAQKANDIIDASKQKQILADGAYCPPLSEELMTRHDLETSCELRQFRCPTCFVFWWKTVPKHKPISTCRRCSLCLNPLSQPEQFGIGRFTCQCNNVFFSRCQGTDSRVCQECGRSVRRPYIHPFFKMDDLHRLPVIPTQRHPLGEPRASSTTAPGQYHFPTFRVPRVPPPHSYSASSYGTSSDLPQSRTRPSNVRFGDFINLKAFYPAAPSVGNPSVTSATLQPTQYAENYSTVPNTSTLTLETNSMTTEDQTTSSCLPNPVPVPSNGNFRGLDGESTATSSSLIVHPDFQPRPPTASGQCLTNSAGDCNPSQQLSKATPTNDETQCTVDNASTSMIVASTSTDNGAGSVDYNLALTTSIASLAIDSPKSDNSDNQSALERPLKVIPLPLHESTAPSIHFHDETNSETDMNLYSNTGSSTAAISHPMTGTIASLALSVATQSHECTAPDYVPPLTEVIPSSESANDFPAAFEDGLNSQALRILSQPDLTDSLSSLNQFETAAMPDPEHGTTVDDELLPNQESPLTNNTLVQADVNSSPCQGSLSDINASTCSQPTEVGIISGPTQGQGSSSLAIDTQTIPSVTSLDSSTNQVSFSAADVLACSQQLDVLSHGSSLIAGTCVCPPQTGLNSLSNQSPISTVARSLRVAVDLTDQGSSPTNNTLSSQQGSVNSATSRGSSLADDNIRLVNQPEYSLDLPSGQASLSAADMPPEVGCNSVPSQASPQAVEMLAAPVLGSSSAIDTPVNPTVNDLQPSSNQGSSAAADDALGSQTQCGINSVPSQGSHPSRGTLGTPPLVDVDSAPIQHSSPACTKASSSASNHEQSPFAANATMVSQSQTETNVSVTVDTSQTNLQVSLRVTSLPHATATTAHDQSSPQAASTSTMPLPVRTTTHDQEATQSSVNISMNVSTHGNTASAPMASTEPQNAPKQAPQQASHRQKFYRDPRNLKYKQVSTLHDCTGSTESTIVPQLIDWPHNYKYKPHHRAYRRPRMPTYDFDDTENNSTIELELEEEDFETPSYDQDNS